MATQDWRIHVRDKNRVNQGPLETYTRATIRLRLNERGSFLIEGCRADDPQALAMMPDDSGQGIAGFMLLRNVAQVVASGPTRQVISSEDTDAWTASDELSLVPRIDLAGIDDTALLATRVIDPAEVGADTHTISDTDAQSMMHLYVGHHASILASTARQIPGLTIAPNSGLGPLMTRTYKYENLLTALQDIGLASQLRFDIRQTVDGFLAFYVSATQDLRTRFLFTVAGGELASIENSITAPQYNHVIRLGKDEGAGRQVDTGQDADSITAWGRIETVIDGRNSVDDTEITTEIQAALEKGAGYESFQVTPAADTDGPQFWDDYNLGDRVAFRTADGRRGEGYVVEVEIVLDGQDGAVVTPTIASTRVAPSSRDSTRALGQRVGKLEAWSENTTILGMVELWGGAVVDIPVHYALADGTGGRPDARNRYLVGAGDQISPGATGGLAMVGGLVSANLAHTHTVAHDHAISGRSSEVYEAGGGADHALDTTVNLTHAGSDKVAREQHTHWFSGTVDGSSDPTSGSGGSAAQNITPPYVGFVVIVRTS